MLLGPYVGEPLRLPTVAVHLDAVFVAAEQQRRDTAVILHAAALRRTQGPVSSAEQTPRPLEEDEVRGPHDSSLPANP